jgi:preprotein translocase subunit SecG
MRLVRALIWLATLFFAAMLFVPLIREVVHRVSSTTQLP